MTEYTSCRSLSECIDNVNRGLAGIQDVIRPFNYFKFVDNSKPAKQQCRECNILVDDKREELVKHLREAHSIDIR